MEVDFTPFFANFGKGFEGLSKRQTHELRTLSTSGSGFCLNPRHKRPHPSTWGPGSHTAEASDDLTEVSELIAGPAEVSPGVDWSQLLSPLARAVWRARVEWGEGRVAKKPTRLERSLDGRIGLEWS